MLSEVKCSVSPASIAGNCRLINRRITSSPFVAVQVKSQARAFPLDVQTITGDLYR